MKLITVNVFYSLKALKNRLQARKRLPTLLDVELKISERNILKFAVHNRNVNPTFLK